MITCLAVVAAGLFLYLGIGFWTGRPEMPSPIAAPTANLERTDTELREKATTELALRLDRLPKVAAPPSFTFYDSLSISVPDPPAALSVLIRGTETTVNPDTHKTISRTDFAVTADYQQGKWFFKSNTLWLTTLF